jgi:hypothetical protein
MSGGNGWAGDDMTLAVVLYAMATSALGLNAWKSFSCKTRENGGDASRARMGRG